MLFAIAALPILGVITMAVDYAKFSSARASIVNYLDAAALEGAKALSVGTEGDARAAAERNFRANVRGVAANIHWRNFQVTASKSTGIVRTQANVSIKLMLGSMFGENNFSEDLFAQARASAGGLPLDIGLMLDVSGSMDGARFDALKSGVRDLLGELIGVGKTSSAIRIGFAPFSSSVNAGSFAASLAGSGAGMTCVGDRKDPNAFTDSAPAGDFTLVDGKHVISNDENRGVYRTGSFKGYGGPAPFDVRTVCPRAEVTPLSGDYNTLNTALTAFRAEGITAGHLGMSFAWYLVSPRWASFWPTGRQPKPADKAKKIVILMSDGEFNTHFIDGSNRRPNDQGKKLCENMKRQDIMIFAISYDFNGGSEDLFRQCVTKPEYMFTPDTTSELIEAFRKIAKEIKPLSPPALTQ